MPASGSDPVSSALRLSLATSERSVDIDKLLVASSSKVLFSRIEYEASGSYKSTVLDNLKGKYIVLNTSGALINGNVCVKSPKKVNEEMRPEPDSVLPTPKTVLFPSEKIQLGWRGTTPTGAGMVNVGNTCYLNSTLQALFHIPAFVNWLQSDAEHLEECCSINGSIQTECIICAVNKTMKASLIKGTSTVKPHLIYNKLKMICKHMNHGQQEDAHEFMRHLIESMEKSFLLRYKSCKLDNYSKETTPLNQIFGGYIRSEVTCLMCRAVSTTFQHFQDLLLDIRRANTLTDALAAYFTHERLDGEDAYRCERCHRKVPAHKKFSLEKPPMVLCIQLKRFNMMSGKLNKHVEFPQRLDLTRFVCQQSQYRGGQPLVYRLVSLVLHMGSSVNCGHYTAVAQTSSGQWYQFDDSSVRPMSLSSVLDTNAYIIIYELDKCEANVPHNHSSVTVKPATVTSVSSQSAVTNGNIAYKVGISRQVTPMMIPSSIKPASVHNGGLSSVHKSVSPVVRKLSPARSPVKITKPDISVANNHSVASLIPAVKERTQPSPQPQSLVPYGPGDSTSTDSEPDGDADDNLVSLVKENVVPSPLASSTPSVNPAPPPTPTPVPVPSPSRKFYIPRNSWQVTEVKVRSSSLVDGSPVRSSSHSPAPVAAATTAWSVSPIHSTRDTTPSSPKQSRSSTTSSQSESQCSSSSQNGTADNDTRAREEETNWSFSRDSGFASCNTTPVNRDREAHCNRPPKENGLQDTDQRRISSSVGQVWDGSARNDITTKLKHMSHQGYAGAQVNSWNGERSQVNHEFEQERKNERKRYSMDDDDDDIDRGRVKKAKYIGSLQDRRPKFNSFQEIHNRKIRWENGGSYYHQNYYRPPVQRPVPYHHKGQYFKNHRGSYQRSRGFHNPRHSRGWQH